MACVVTFGQLPDEEPAFLAYLQKSGEVWARAVNDDLGAPRYEPLPAAEFLQRFAAMICQYHSVSVYLGFRPDVLQPVLGTYEVIEGGTQIPFVQFGKVVPGVHTIVGGTKVRKRCIAFMDANLIRYDRGEFRDAEEVALSNLCYYSGYWEQAHGRQPRYVNKPQEFLKWAKKVLDWMRRRTPERAPVAGCNYSIRATKRLAEACRGGLKLR